MAEFKKGDRVRVTYEAEWDPDRGTHYWLRDPSNATVELIEQADDPSQDPIGTVREWRGEPAIRMAEGPEGFEDLYWVFPSGGANGHTTMEGTEIIGAVPGSPADRATPAPSERPLWTGDGSEEPPEYVTKVRDKDGMHLVRSDGGWHGVATDTDPWDVTVKSWGFRWPEDYAPFIEVRD